MKIALKLKLYELIQDRGVISFQDVKDLCEIYEYKLSNGERRLRQLTEAGLIEPIRKKRVIIGYRKKETELGRIMRERHKISVQSKLI